MRVAHLPISSFLLFTTKTLLCTSIQYLACFISSFLSGPYFSSYSSIPGANSPGALKIDPRRLPYRAIGSSLVFTLSHWLQSGTEPGDLLACVM